MSPSSLGPGPAGVTLRGGLLVTMDAENRVLREDLRLSGGSIAGVGGYDAGTVIAPSDRMEVRDISGCVVTPALINAHLHLGETYLRSRIGDLTLENYIAAGTASYEDPGWRALSAEVHRAATRQTLVEAALAGTGTVCGARGWAEVASSGLRARLGYPVCASPKLKDFHEAFPDEFDRRRREETGDLLRTILYVQSPLDLDSRAAGLVAERLAADPSLRFYTHVAESEPEVRRAHERFGLTPFELLENYGLLGEQAILVHCVHATEKDIELVARSGAGVVLCPTANARLGVGVPLITAWFEALGADGAKLAVGTDGLATNDSASLLEAAKFAVLIARVGAGRRSGSGFAATAALRAVTRGAAGVMFGRCDRPVAGVLETGAAADVAVWAPRGGSPEPGLAVESLVYNGSNYALRDLIVAGRVVVDRGRPLFADPARTSVELHEVTARLFGEGEEALTP